VRPRNGLRFATSYCEWLSRFSKKYGCQLSDPNPGRVYNTTESKKLLKVWEKGDVFGEGVTILSHCLTQRYSSSTDCFTIEVTYLVKLTLSALVLIDQVSAKCWNVVVRTFVAPRIQPTSMFCFDILLQVAVRFCQETSILFSTVSTSCFIYYLYEAKVNTSKMRSCPCAVISRHWNVWRSGGKASLKIYLNSSGLCFLIAYSAYSSTLKMKVIFPPKPQ
jgi:hypothetical protein